MWGGNQEVKIAEPKICAVRGQENNGKTEQKLEYGGDKANSLTTVQKDNLLSDNFRIRKLTPKECYLLMGFDPADYDKAKSVNSDSQLYKQAGNSIVVNVLEAIFKEML